MYSNGYRLLVNNLVKLPNPKIQVNTKWPKNFLELFFQNSNFSFPKIKIKPEENNMVPDLF